MSELITLIHHETDTRMFKRTLEDTMPRQRARGCQVGPLGPS